MKKKFLISTGGSGGHVVPAIILYEHLTKEIDVIISTDKRGLKYLDKSIYKLEIVDTPKLKNIFFLPFYFIIILILTIKSLYLLMNKKIEKVFSIGGYMSLPIILAAKLLNLKIYLIEPNHVLGRANKFYLNFSKKIFCYSEKIINFPDKFKNKLININPLIKKEIYGTKFPDEINNQFTLLIVGGSQGANFFDNNLKNIVVNISKKLNIKVIQQTSKKNTVFLKNFYATNNVENQIFSFSNDFIKKILQADLCITRAGASTLAELSFLNVPFIAVPLPNSKDNHQFENANFYKNNDCCWLIEQKYFDEKIEDLLKEIIINKTNYLKKKQNLKKLNYQNTWINVNQKILGIIDEN